MRANLEKVAKSDPDMVVNGYVFLKKRIPIETFVPLLKDYQVIVPDGNPAYEYRRENIQIYYEPPNNPAGAGVAALSLEPEHFDIYTFYQWVEESTRLKYASPSSIRVNSFSGRATLENFLKMWQENEDIVRGIGTGCTNVSYNVGLQDPVEMPRMSWLDRRLLWAKLLLVLAIEGTEEIKEFFE